MIEFRSASTKTLEEQVASLRQSSRDQLAKIDRGQLPSASLLIHRGRNPGFWLPPTSGGQKPVNPKPAMKLGFRSETNVDGRFFFPQLRGFDTFPYISPAHTFHRLRSRFPCEVE